MGYSTSCRANKAKIHSLSLFRLFRGLFCLLVFFSSAFVFLVYFAPFAALLLRIFSIHHSRKTVSYIFAVWLALWPFLFEKINGTKVVFYGDAVPKGERVLVIANHRTEVDWMYLWDLALRKGCLGSVKYILKNNLMELPVFGWGFHVLEFIPVHRKWEVDEPILRDSLSTFTSAQDPLWLVLFPEGTDFTEQKCQRCQEVSRDTGLPVLSNTLFPKTRGFCTCLEILRDSLDAVYDLSIAYKHHNPTFLDNVFGFGPFEVHIHVRRIPVMKIPPSTNEAAGWLIDAFKIKDQMLSDMFDHGRFQNEGTEKELSTLMCFLNFILVISLTAFFIFLTLFSSIWFKVYVAFACMLLALATRYRALPSSISQHFKREFCCGDRIE